MSNKKQLGTLGNFFSFCLVFIILLCYYPYEFYSAYLHNPTNTSLALYLFWFLIVGGLTAVISRKKPNMPSYLYIIVVFQCVGFVVCSFFKGDSFPTGPIMVSALSVLMIVFLSSSCGLVSFFNKYNHWFLIMTALGVIAFVLVWVGILRPVLQFEDLSDDEIMYNFIITFSQRDYADGFRFCGFFDEPGALASWGMYSLLINKLFIKDNRLEKILIILLIATFSLGYYIQLFAYLLLFFVFKKDRKKDTLGAISLFAALLIIYSILNSFQGTQYDELYQQTIGRVEQYLDDSFSGGGIAVGDREELTLQAQVAFYNNPLFGTTDSALELGNNIYEPLALYGIVGTFFIYFPFLFIFIDSIKKRDKELLKCFLVMFLGFTHRPFHINLLSFFIIYSFIVMCYQQRHDVKLANG